MRGFKLVGRVNDPSTEASIDDDDLVFFALDRNGEHMRTGWYRGRVLKRLKIETLGWRPPSDAFAANAICYDDFVFIATAIGEECFK